MAEEKKNIPKLRFREFTGDNANAWELRKLGRISDISTGKAFKSSEFDKSGEFLVVTNKEISDSKFSNKVAGDRINISDDKILNKYVLIGQNILVTMDGVNIGKVGKYTNSKAVLAQRVGRVQSKQFDFVYAVLDNQKFVNKMNVLAVGNAIKHISLSQISDYHFWLPICDVEQQKIGSFFKHLDELITLHQRMLDEYKTLKKTMLSKIFPKNGEKYPELRFFGFTDAWEQRKLGEIVEWSKGSGLSKDALNIQGIGVPVIHYADLYKFNSVQKEVIHWTMNDIGTKIPENNLLFPMSDVTPDGLARTSTVLQSNVKAGGDVLIAKLNKDILSTFMSYQINRNKNQILPLVTGTTVRHINSKSLSTLKVTVPGKNEQKYVGSILMRFDSLIALHQRELELLKTLKKTMLQQMFV